MPACDERIALIADRGLTSQGPLLSLVEKLLVLGLGQVLLREKGLAEPDLLALAEPIQKACAEKGARFIVNSSFSVALKTKANGLHLPFAALVQDAKAVAQAKSHGLTVGVSVHSLTEAFVAQEAKADLVMAGPIFPTPSKPGHPGQGLNFISELRANLPLGLAVWAVGGINPKNVKSVFAAGAQAAALRSWLVATEDPDPVASLLTALA